MEMSSRSLKQKAQEQMKEFFLIVVYLWLVFGILVVYKSVVLAEYSIPFAYHGFALINALALGKIMLVAKDLHLGERFDDAPLIYPTLLKSAMYTLVLACFKILEEGAVGLHQGKSFSQSMLDLAGGSFRGILTLALLIFVMLIPFVGFGELERVVGEDRLKKLFFRPRSPQDQTTTEAL